MTQERRPVYSAYTKKHKQSLLIVLPEQFIRVIYHFRDFVKFKCSIHVLTQRLVVCFGHKVAQKKTILIHTKYTLYPQ